LLVRLSTVLALSRSKIVDLAAAWREGSGVPTLDPEENKFSNVPEIEADASTIRTTIFSYFVPHDV